MTHYFGSNNQVVLTDEQLFEVMGFLCKAEVTLVWEDNDLCGAWGKEGRVQFRIPCPYVFLPTTAGVGNILERLNCNDFVEYLVTNYGYQRNRPQNYTLIKSRIPKAFEENFDAGYNR